MSEKKNVGVVFGGKSGEYDVSLLSAYNVINGINKEKFDITMIGITLEGKFYIYKGDVEKIKTNEWINDSKNLISDFSLFDGDIINNVDIIFPVLHGQNGEDGRIQGLFEMMDKPYVGCEVLASSVCMDKDIAKRIFRSVGIPVVDDVLVFNTDIETDKLLEATLDRCEENLPYPMFVKPVNMGSSVGISKAKDRDSLKEALLKAVKFDTKILVEKGINAREIEVAVLGNSHPEASYPGEIVSCKEFYDYEAKYLSGDGSRIDIPAKIDDKIIEKIRTYAVKAFKAVGGSGLSRVDFFLDKDSKDIYLNEANTLPGFTNISMYAKMWDYMGIGYSDLIEKLIDLGFERYEIKHRLTIKE
ncbi:D-alanine--D-alanine ligase family protein [Anaerofustis stercorihominis]|uniref:D-alanine--D-alanine ligase n=2 Tax=Anaerofustis stercorihominis TaxID=214853 RepID=B1CAT5_9FIRM|nr:D-alanine--D-alanine ligase family protein [Anaerofustis stercorihominis]EDS71382.1 D-ala D-ala ligase N-terminal domain protein [Anaerofustis stercorihominis DSM 17244]MCQ4795334.1 D-alanine--D-alanine ligase [Anaerofustis stercorihominis]RGD73426.1 D-alanine--D-alanine ligase [Anaerofustis stercorihominis]